MSHGSTCNLPNSNQHHKSTMADITLNSDQLKAALKSAIIELLQDNKAEFSELLAEIIEDMAMERAIAEGKTTELVSRDTIFQLLEPKA